MGKLKKIKKLVARAELAAERAEEAHRRVASLTGREATVGDDHGEERRPFYTSPSGLNATPPAAQG